MVIIIDPELLMMSINSHIFSNIIKSPDIWGCYGYLTQSINDQFEKAIGTRLAPETFNDRELFIFQFRNIEA